ncbi:nucleotidyltransferase family protein [Thioalkalivibrio sp. ARh3]|uniref:nucleotidyltransferase family protein n=1 Tax=Thioalkalivibrio sp. ARh3 TaxID=1158148 RepID=UPI000377BFF3|nr:nucleotidyltransferase domain-containing protein [Thioalkalivibrio sp. ARh3]
MLQPEQISRINELAARHRWRLVILFGSVAREGHGRDVDLAVEPQAMPDLMTQGRWQRELEEIFEPVPVDLLLLSDRMSPVTRFEVFRDGECLFEEREGRFHAEQDRAFFLHADSVLFQRHITEDSDAA